MIRALLLAQLPFLTSARKALSSGPSGGEVFAFVVSVLGFILVVALAVWWTRRRNRPRRIDFLTAAVDVAGLTEQDRRDLRFVAQHAELRYPTSMLLTPANFARAVERAVEASAQPEPLRTRMTDLGRRLFADGAPPGPPSESPDPTAF